MKKFIGALKKLFKKSKKGFTLIELLVVIGILGILAAALIATIDPFEQLNKAQDSTVKNTMVEYVTANIRYYATHNEYPWGASAACTPSVISDATTGSAGAPYRMSLCSGGDPTNGIGCVVSTCIQPLINDRELKASFVSSVGTLSKIYITYYGTGGGVENQNTLVACYKPSSQSGRKDVNTRYKQDGTAQPAGTCVSQCVPGGACGTDATCYWCTK